MVEESRVKWENHWSTVQLPNKLYYVNDMEMKLTSDNRKRCTNVDTNSIYEDCYISFAIYTWLIASKS